MAEKQEVTHYTGAYALFDKLSQQLDARYLDNIADHTLNREIDYGYGTASPIVDVEGNLFPLLCQTARMDISDPWTISSLQRVFQHSNGYDPKLHDPAQVIQNDTFLQPYPYTQGRSFKELAGYLAQPYQKATPSAKIIRGVDVLRPGMQPHLSYHVRINSIQQSEMYTFFPSFIRFNGSYPVIPNMSDFYWMQNENPEFFLSAIEPYYVEPVVFLPAPMYLNIEAIIDPYSYQGLIGRCTLNGKSNDQFSISSAENRVTVSQIPNRRFGQKSPQVLADLCFDPKRLPYMCNLSEFPFMDGVMSYYDESQTKNENQPDYIDGQVIK